MFCRQKKIAIFRPVRKTARSDYQLRQVCLAGCLSVWLAVCLPACLPARPPACLSIFRPYGRTRLQWTNFREILYLGIFQKIVMKIQVSLQFDKNNGYFTRRIMYTYYSISLNSFQNEKYFRPMLYRKSKHTFHVQYLRFDILQYKINVE